MESSKPKRSKEPKPDPIAKRIAWARSLSNTEVVYILQMKLLESRAAGRTEVVLLNELVHEIKHRLDKGKVK
jgi:hypothetical protein